MLGTSSRGQTLSVQERVTRALVRQLLYNIKSYLTNCASRLDIVSRYIELASKLVDAYVRV